MSNYDIIRAWKDEDYLASLSEEQRSQLPENPAGIVEMSDEDMEDVGGGGSNYHCGGSYYDCGDDNTNTNGENCVCNSNGDYCDNSNDYCPTFGIC